MKLISINVSQPKEIEWKGRTVRTSIFKLPVDGRRHVGKLNIEGDAQADLEGHGGEHRAIFVYQKDSYDYWKKELQRGDLSYGQFGENFTVEGLADAEVCIGDRYQIGSAIFEVTQPRVTCYKIGISLNLPEMPALLVKHQRPGFYFRVIREGEVGAGDAILRLSIGPGAMTVVETDGLLYGAAHPADRLLQALQIGALSEGWRGSFKELYQAAISGSWRGFLSFKVNRVTKESEGVRSFQLSPADGRALPAFTPGEHIAVKIPVPGSEPLIRMYSLCGPPGQKNYRIAVKEEKNGSYYLHHHIREGDHLDLSAPRGSFILADNMRPLVLMGAGIGITPLLSMLYSSAGSKTQRELWWIYSTRNKSHYPFISEIKVLTGQIATVHSTTIFSNPTGEDVPGKDFDISGRLTPGLLQQLHLPPDGDYYLCGPESYLVQVAGALKDLGIPAGAIKYEAFGNLGVPVTGRRPPHPPEAPVGEGPEVSFTKSGISFKWHPRFASLLEVAEACDVPASWSCRSGVCHHCETTLFAGEVSYKDEPLDEPMAGNVLICCAVPKTDLQLDL